MHAHLSEIEILIIENIIAMETPETVSMGAENCKHLRAGVERCRFIPFHLFWLF